MTQIPATRDRAVSAHVSDWSFLGIHFSNKFVNSLPDDLQGQCQGGKLTGLLTKYESTLYVFMVEREVTVRGFCVPGDGPAPAVRATPVIVAPPTAPPVLPAPPAAPAISASPGKTI